MNLVIGNTSQQSHYYPDDFIKISSRNINFNFLKENKFNGIYITFAEQRIYEKNIDFITPNFNYTLKIINEVIDNCDKIVIFTSCELWSNLSGLISVDTTPNFNITNQYTLSKLILFNEIKRLRIIDDKYKKVVILHPFYFNSVYRNDYFLFGKIFYSIINKKKINVGNLNFYRDIVHTSFVVKKAIELKEDSMIGAGRLYNVKELIVDLYKSFNMNYNDFVTEDLTLKSNDKMIRANVNWEYTYNDLLNDNILDIKKIKNLC
jgi:nucleoside-diphosphate-sugar epimerase